MDVRGTATVSGGPSCVPYGGIRRRRGFCCGLPDGPAAAAGHAAAPGRGPHGLHESMVAPLPLHPPAPRRARLEAALGLCRRAGPTAAVPHEVLDAVCAAVVGDSPGDLAVVAFCCAGAAGPVDLAASAGAVAVLPVLNLGTGEAPLTDLIGAALLQGRPVVCRRTRSDPAHARWADHAWRLGFGLACAAPFEAGPGRTGVLALFSPDEHAFGADELDLLVDIAAALART